MFSISEGTSQSLYSKLLEDKFDVKTRTDFSTSLTTDNINTLYTGTENGTQVYYFAGNATDNWVKLGGYYWRIIRTNADGGIRLLYHSISPTAENAYIGTSAFNSTSDDSKYVGYKYDDNVSSTIKTFVDTWYESSLKNKYSKYLSETAIYCNDRSSSENNDYFGAYTRLSKKNKPSYNCINDEDKYTVSTSTGNGSLTYPIGLSSADELVLAGGVYNSIGEVWYYNNSEGDSSVSNKSWWTMTPYSDDYIFMASGAVPGFLTYYKLSYTIVVRPVISLKSCVKYSSGDGSATNPYTIVESESGC